VKSHTTLEKLKIKYAKNSVFKLGMGQLLNTISLPKVAWGPVLFFKWVRALYEYRLCTAVLCAWNVLFLEWVGVLFFNTRSVASTMWIMICSHGGLELFLNTRSVASTLWSMICSHGGLELCMAVPFGACSVFKVGWSYLWISTRYDSDVWSMFCSHGGLKLYMAVPCQTCYLFTVGLSYLWMPALYGSAMWGLFYVWVFRCVGSAYEYRVCVADMFFIRVGLALQVSSVWGMLNVPFFKRQLCLSVPCDSGPVCIFTLWRSS